MMVSNERRIDISVDTDDVGCLGSGSLCLLSPCPCRPGGR